jgi:hypothetical protein
MLAFMLNGMVETKHPTIEQLIQIIPLHMSHLQVIHKAAGTKLPMTVGLVTSTQHPSPLRTPTIFGMSVCQADFFDPNNKEVRRLNQADMRGHLEAMVGRRLPEAAGRCVEDHAFLGSVLLRLYMRNYLITLSSLEDALRQKLPMLSLVVGTKYLLNGSRAADDLLAASSNLEIRQFMDANRHQITFQMCPECQLTQREMQAEIVDLAVTDWTRLISHVST